MTPARSGRRVPCPAVRALPAGGKEDNRHPPSLIEFPHSFPEAPRPLDTQRAPAWTAGHPIAVTADHIFVADRDNLYLDTFALGRYQGLAEGHRVQLAIDPDDEIPESNEGDNACNILATWGGEPLVTLAEQQGLVHRLSEDFIDNFGIRDLRFSAVIPHGGASPVMALQAAATVLATGVCKHVIITFGRNVSAASNQSLPEGVIWRKLASF